MKKFILILLAAFLWIALPAQLSYEYTASDSVCIENDFTYFIPLYPNRNLVTKSNEYYVVDDTGEKVFDLLAYDNLVYVPYNDELMPVKGKDSGKFGYINTEGVLKVPLEYEYASSFCDGVAIVRQSEKYGLIDTQNQIVVPIIYEGIRRPNGNRYPVVKGKLYGLMDSDGQLLMDYKYSDLSFLKNDGLKVQTNFGYKYLDPVDFKESKKVYEALVSFSSDIVKYRSEGHWGLMNSKGKVIVQNIYTRINSLTKGAAIVRAANKKYGLINEEGSIVIPVEYDEMKDHRLFISAKKNDGYYFYDHTGNRILKDNNGPIKKIGPCDLFLNTSVDSLFSLQYLNGEAVFDDVLFQQIRTVSNNSLLAKTNEAWCYYPLDKSKPIGPFERAQAFYDDKAIVQSKSGKYCIINGEGKTLTEEYDEIKKQSNTYVFKKKGRWGISSDFKNISVTYNKLRMVDYNSQVFEVKSGEKYGLVRDGKIILPIEYDKIKGDFAYGGLLEVWKNDELSVVNNSGDVLSKPKINFVDYSKYGLTLVSTETGFGMLDENLHFVLDPIYEDLRSFNDGKRCAVKMNGLWGYVNREGEYVMEPKFKTVLDFSSSHDVTGVEDESGWRLMSDKGVFITNDTYSKIELISNSNDYFQVQSEGKWGVIDITGEVIIPTRFTSLRKKRDYWELYLDDESIRLDNKFRCIKNCSENSLKELLK